MKLAQYAFRENDLIRCGLCPHQCLLKEGKTGVCGARKNLGGDLYSVNYGKISAINIDPIEKKPLFHYMPGTMTYSVGSFGCNLMCPFCQNYQISHQLPPTREITPEELIQRTLESGVPSLSFTYNEPGVSFEYVREAAELAHMRGLRTIMVTNGYLNPEPLQELIPVIDAMNIDLKAFSQETYERICGGSLQPVLDTIEAVHRYCHLEVTVLLVTGMHSRDEIEALGAWLAKRSVQIPVHVSRYFPAYRFHEPSTPLEWIHETRDRLSKHLKYVYAGNC